MKTIRWTGLLLSACLFLAVLAPSALAAKSSEAHVVKYVAFGDSITAGYEPGMDASSIAYGYVDRLYEQALLRGRASFVNYAILGLKTEGLAKMIQAVADERQVSSGDIQENLRDPRADAILSDTKRIKKDVEEATFITITIGGNDFGVTIADKAKSMSDSEFESFTEELLNSYQTHLTALLKNLFKMNPDALIFVADQYSPYPPINKELYNRLQKGKDRFTETLLQVEQSFRAEGYSLTAVKVAQEFVGKEGNYLHIADGDIHPKQRGYDKFAELFAISIWGEYRTDLAKCEPITVVVGGNTLDSPHKPVLISDLTFVPIREYAEALGAVVEWEAETRTATVRLDDRSVAMTIGSDTILVNGREQKIEAAPQYLESGGESKTYIPLRLMAEGLGYDVQYVQQSSTAYINR